MVWARLSRDKGRFTFINELLPDFAGYATVAGAQHLVGDFDGDRRPDVAIVGPQGWQNLPVALSKENGTFQVVNREFQLFQSWAADPGVRAFVRRFNADERADIVLSGGPRYSKIPVALSRGDGTFDLQNTSLPEFQGWAREPGARLLSGDFHGDGFTDLAILGAATWQNEPVAFARGDSTFGWSNEFVGDFIKWSNQSAEPPSVGDFDGDGKSDFLLVGTAGSTQARFAFSRGDGSFDVTSSFAGGALSARARLVGRW